jgi:hypothetical protein
MNHGPAGLSCTLDAAVIAYAHDHNTWPARPAGPAGPAPLRSAAMRVLEVWATWFDIRHCRRTALMACKVRLA